MYVTNKWLVGILVGLIMTMGGYMVTGYDRTWTAQATQVRDLELKLTRIESQYEEILRRLDRIENAVWLRQNRNQVPLPQ